MAIKGLSSLTHLACLYYSCMHGYQMVVTVGCMVFMVIMIYMDMIDVVSVVSIIGNMSITSACIL